MTATRYIASGVAEKVGADPAIVIAIITALTQVLMACISTPEKLAKILRSASTDFPPIGMARKTRRKLEEEVRLEAQSHGIDEELLLKAILDECKEATGPLLESLFKDLTDGTGDWEGEMILGVDTGEGIARDASTPSSPPPASKPKTGGW